MMVVIFHLFPSRLTGGFAGVDVFFVISGFLISSSLLGELEASGRIGLANFWAKRMRRLLPAAFLVIAVTVIFSAIFVPPFTRAEFLAEGLASIFYYENWNLALSSADYFADSNASPFQHFWSLAVEEQFYLVWPIALLVLALVAKTKAKAAITALIAASALISFSFAVALTQLDPGAAYFNSFLRVWQFAVGASIAHLLANKSLSMRLSPMVSVAGIALIVWSAFYFEAGSGFPGFAALVPVLGAALVIIAGLGGLPARLIRIYKFRPIQFLGDISYSLYLWHWPVIVLAPFMLNRAASTLEKLLMLAISIALAWATKRFIEDPARTSRMFVSGKPRLTIVTALVSSVALAVSVTAVSVATPRSVVSDVISLDQAKHDAADIGSNCMTKAEASEVIWCNFGNQSAAYRVLLIGDSHAATHLSGFKELAVKHDWALTLAYKAGCSFSLVERNASARGNSCTAWNKNLQAGLSAQAPFNLVVTANYSNNFLADVKSDNWVQLAIAGYREAWQPLIERGAKVVALRDNPQMTETMLLCWNEAVLDASNCAGPRDEMLHPDYSQQAATDFAGAFALDLTDLYCDSQTCPSQRNGTYIYRNADHLSATYARVISGELYNRLQNLLGRP
jgi:peptidoglycan/LPS O-acetylase OafA/YrhL